MHKHILFKQPFPQVNHVDKNYLDQMAVWHTARVQTQTSYGTVEYSDLCGYHFMILSPI